MEKRIKYSLYKKGYSNLPTVPGSYDAATKTILVVMPDASPAKWGKEFLPTGGNARRLDGFHIYIRFNGAGPAASYRVEALPDPGKSWNPRPFSRVIPEIGNAGKIAAMTLARELAQNPDYKY